MLIDGEECDVIDVKGFEGRYLISKKGHVISYGTRKTKQSGHIILSARHDNSGYLYVNLYNSNLKRFTKKIHRLVAENFIPNPFCFDTINHKNGIKTDNHVDNLEWCTVKHNAQHRDDNGLSARGFMHKRNKSGYAGVCADKNCKNKKWVAKICVKNKTISLGYFYTKEEAAKAYNDASLKYHGNTGKLNIIKSQGIA